MKHWTLDDIPWDAFQADQVDPDIVKIVKAAAMVEHNSHDYAAYLCRVFDDDESFQALAREWAIEEVQHGDALGRWAEMVDSNFDFQAAFARFREGFKIPVDATKSVRGSRPGEMVARCMVEVGTSSYYTVLGESIREPVLKEICRRIAADEFRHYKLFYDNLKRYLKREKIGRWRRFFIAMGRINESEDDELAYAFYSANHSPDHPYDRKACFREMMKRAYPLYRVPHLRRVVTMTLKAAGLKPREAISMGIARVICSFMHARARRAA